MATGIDKKQHKLLIECIDRLLEGETDPQEWLNHKEELNGAFEELLHAIKRVEQAIVQYKNLYAGIRPLASKAHRSRRKKA